MQNSNPYTSKKTTSSSRSRPLPRRACGLWRAGALHQHQHRHHERRVVDLPGALTAGRSPAHWLPAPRSGRRRRRPRRTSRGTCPRGGMTCWCPHRTGGTRRARRRSGGCRGTRWRRPGRRRTGTRGSRQRGERGSILKKFGSQFYTYTPISDRDY
ncbi:hypothetical protein GQ55_9G565800 [Panicum hallii var. hallii]|uniref:Uncharacterized protein n=1 Tax=Panicum hallii var. hallii TaxID=1504633 RepID=A0A2T7CFY3_9POAL|nr:hypothetical protein GQ55_9G565800 [Panicum hallii var. hallii]